MTSQEILQQAINGVLAEKTLSKDAIDAVQELLTDNEQLKLTDKTRKEELIGNRRTIDDLNDQNTDLRTKLGDFEARELAVSEREKKADLLDLTVKYEQTRVNDIKEWTGLVFRNTNIIRRIHGNKPMEVHPGPNGNMGYPQNVNFDETTEEVEQ